MPLILLSTVINDRHHLLHCGFIFQLRGYISLLVMFVSDKMCDLHLPMCEHLTSFSKVNYFVKCILFTIYNPRDN